MCVKIYVRIFFQMCEIDMNFYVVVAVVVVVVVIFFCLAKLLRLAMLDWRGTEYKMFCAHTS